MAHWDGWLSSENFYGDDEGDSDVELLRGTSVGEGDLQPDATDRSQQAWNDSQTYTGPEPGPFDDEDEEMEDYGSPTGGDGAGGSSSTPVSKNRTNSNWEDEDDDENKNRSRPSKTEAGQRKSCLLYTSPSPRDRQKSRMPSSA